MTSPSRANTPVPSAGRAQPDLRRRAVEPALAVRGVLDGHEHRAAPLAADGDALDDPQDDEQDRGGDADRGVRRQEADQRPSRPPSAPSSDQRRRAADAVADVARRSGRRSAGRRSRSRRWRRRAGSRRWVDVAEEQLREDDPRGRGEQEEVVPLDRGADQRRDQDGARAGVGTVDGTRDSGGRGHGGPLLRGGRAGGQPARQRCAREPAEIDVATGHEERAERGHPKTVPSGAPGLQRRRPSGELHRRRVWSVDVSGVASQTLSVRIATHSLSGRSARTRR